ncbi:beta-secretase 1-like [Saccostrea echinata]|uniref:beta-secretase 1-like n=1 Tax=Saccostrea echinata TaxID=191078 RepID=UPI002A82D799|nr:beta-secretase 1-like [Saccostrea echinata]
MLSSPSSTTYKLIGISVYVPYTQGNWRGTLGSDLVTLTSLPNVTVRANIAFITESKQFFINGSNWQDILGLAYRSIARTFGGVDPGLHSSPVYYTNIHKQWCYEVVMVDVEVDGGSINLDCKEYNFPKTIVNSGTTDLRFPIMVYASVIKHIKNYVQKSPNAPPVSLGFWNGDIDLCYKDGAIPYNIFPFVALEFAENEHQSFKIIVAPQQYIKSVGKKDDKNPDEICFKLGIANSTSGKCKKKNTYKEGGDDVFSLHDRSTVIGAVIMEGFYVVFDRQNSRIGFSDTTCPAVAQMFNKSHVSGPHKFSGSVGNCAYAKPEKNNKTLVIVAYVLAGICGACILPLFILFIQYQWRTSKCYEKMKRKNSDGDSNDLIDETNFMHDSKSPNAPPESLGFWNGDIDLCYKDGAIPYNIFPFVALEFAENEQHSFKIIKHIKSVWKKDDNNPDEICFKLGIANSTSGSVGNCAYAKPEKSNKTFVIVAYVLVGICGACILPLFILFIQYQWRTSKCYEKTKR